MILLKTVAIAVLLAAWWLLVAASMIGVGSLFRRWCRTPSPDPWDLPLTFWLGLALTILVLQAWHFLLPIDVTAVAFVGVVALSGLVLERRTLLETLRRATSSTSLTGGLCVLAFALWLANSATAACCTYDTGLYSLPVVEWTRTHPVVPGIGALFANLGFNNASLLWATLLDAVPLGPPAWSVVHGVMLLVLGVSGIAAVVAAWRGPRASPVVLARVVLITPVIYMAMQPSLSSLDTDQAAALSLLAIVPEGFQLLSGRTPEDSGEVRHRAFRIVAVVTVMLAVACMKLSMAMFCGLLTIVIALVGVVQLRRADPRLGRRVLVGSTLAILLFGLTWAGRGIVMTGYPVFPSAGLSVPVQWRVPEAQARGTHAWLRQAALPEESGSAAAGEARVDRGTPGIETSWRSLFLNGDVRIDHAGAIWAATLPLWLTALGAGLVLWRRRRSDRVLAALVGIVGPASLAITYWAIMIPSVRFVSPILWVVGALTLGSGIALAAPRRTRIYRGVLAALVMMGSTPAWLPAVQLMAGEGLDAAEALRELHFVRAPDQGLFEPLPESPLTRFRTDSGLELLVPAGNDMRCLRAPLPCTPHPAANLVSRESGNLGAGFTVVGTWRPERWPNPWTPAFREEWFSRSTHETRP